MKIFRPLQLLLAYIVLSIQAGLDRLMGFPLPLGLGADLSITAASVLASPLAKREKRYTAGGTLTAGMNVVLNDDEQWVAYDGNGTLNNEYTRKRGITEHGAALNQPVSVVTSDPGLTLGATLTVGQTYVASGTAGGIAPIADLTTGDYPVVLGVARTAALLNLNPTAGGAAKP